jgi:hypothetical protein
MGSSAFCTVWLYPTSGHLVLLVGLAGGPNEHLDTWNMKGRCLYVVVVVVVVTAVAEGVGLSATVGWGHGWDCR